MYIYVYIYMYNINIIIGSEMGHTAPPIFAGSIEEPPISENHMEW